MTAQRMVGSPKPRIARLPRSFHISAERSGIPVKGVLAGELKIRIERLEESVARKWDIDPVDAELALGVLETFIPHGSAGRMVEAIVDEKQVAEPGVDALAAQ